MHFAGIQNSTTVQIRVTEPYYIEKGGNQNFVN